MKKLKKIFFICCICTGLMGGMVLAKPPLRIYLDNEKMQFNVAPTIENGTTLVPFRTIFERLGFSITWEASTRTITAVKEDIIVQMTVGETGVLVNDEVRELPVAPKLIRSTTFIPLKMVSEIAGKEVIWDAENYRVLIGETDQVPLEDAPYAEITTSQAITLGQYTVHDVQFEDGFRISLGPKIVENSKFTSYYIIIENNSGFPVAVKNARFVAKQDKKEWPAVLRGIKDIDNKSVKNMVLLPGEKKQAYVTFATTENILRIFYSDEIHKVDLTPIQPNSEAESEPLAQ